MGPSKGMPLIISAAEAALIDRTSWGFSWSAPRTVVTTCVSLRKPSANDGRSGRSVRRHVRMASSVGRPSRRKNEPGILPAAYARSSTSTVRGKKSMPGRTSWAALAVVRTDVSPMVATTAPWLCGASLPVSKVSVRSVPDTGPDTRMGSATNGSFHARHPPGGSWSGRPVPSRRSRWRAHAATEGATGNRRSAARWFSPGYRRSIRPSVLPHRSAGAPASGAPALRRPRTLGWSQRRRPRRAIRSR